LADVVQIVIEGVDKATDVLGGIGGALGKLGGIAGGVALAGVAAFGAALVKGVGDARESAVLLASTEQTIASMGNAAGVSAQHVVDMASALSDAAGKSLFGDDQIQQSTNLLLTFGEIKGATLDAATALTVDLAQALGGAPKDQAMMLGKALNDPIHGMTALGKAGLTFSEEQKAAIKAMQESGNMAGAQKIILDELNKQVGGQAEAAAKATGGWSQLKGRMGEAAETMGAALLPLLNGLAGLLNDKVMPFVEKAAAGFGTLISAFQTGAQDGGGFIGGLTNALYSLDSVSPIFDTIGDGINGIVDAFRDAGPLSSEFGESLGYLAQQLGLPAPLVDALEQGLGALQGVASGVMAAFSDGGIGGALQFLADKLAEVSPGFALLKGIVEAALPPIQDIVLSVFGIIGGFIEEHGAKIQSDLTGAWQAVQGLIAAVLPPIQSIVSTIFGAIAEFLHTHGADIQAFLGSTWDQIASIVTTAVQLVQAIIVPIFTAIASFLAAHGTEIQGLLGNTWNAIKAIIDGALTLIQGVLKVALQLIQGDWSGAWETVKSTFSRLWEDIKVVFDSALGNLKILLGGAIQWIKDEWGKLPDQMLSIGRAIVDGIRDGISGGWAALTGWIADKARGLLSAAKSALGISSPSKLFADQVGVPIVQGIAAGILAAASVAKDALAGLASDLLDQIGDLADKAQRAMGDALVAGAGGAADIARQRLRVFDDLSDLSQAAQAAANAAIKEAESQTASLQQRDPKLAADFYQLRTSQILELAKLQDDLSKATDDAERARLEAKIKLTEDAQAKERDAFLANAKVKGDALDVQKAQLMQTIATLQQSRDAAMRIAPLGAGTLQQIADQIDALNAQLSRTKTGSKRENLRKQIEEATKQWEAAQQAVASESQIDALLPSLQQQLGALPTSSAGDVLGRLTSTGVQLNAPTLTIAPGAIVVNGATGQSVDAIADKVIQKIQYQVAGRI
jgi:phage-related protein